MLNGEKKRLPSSVAQLAVEIEGEGVVAGDNLARFGLVLDRKLPRLQRIARLGGVVGGAAQGGHHGEDSKNE